MRIAYTVSIGLIAMSVQSSLVAQEDELVEILAAAELAYPDAKAPELFGPGSASEAYAFEPEDPDWSAEREARILAAVDVERERGLIFRRAEVECRSSTCALILIHATGRGDGSVGGLATRLRDSLGFAGMTLSEVEVPVQRTVRSGTSSRTRTWFLKGYSEILLSGGGSAASVAAAAD